MKQLKKALAVFLAILTIFTTCSVVMPVFAEYELVTDGNVTNGNVQEDTVLEEETEPQILSEITEKREENTKHFLMSDGSFMVAQYNSPVHYQDESGTWIDIDNMISETEATAEQTELFGTDEIYSTNNITDNVIFAEKSNSNTLVSYEAKDYPISLNYRSAKKSNIKIIEKEDELEGNNAFLTLPNVSQEVIYENVFSDVDLQYIVSPTELKENIILKSKKAQNSFTLNYSIGELTAEVVDSKTINLMAGEEVVYTISAPYMYDANGEKSENLTMTVEKNKNGKLTLVLTADSTWLNAEERVYPVVVDPSIVEKEDKDIIATYVSSAAANTIHGDVGSDLHASKGDSTHGTSYALLKLENIESNIYADHVVSAKLNLPLNTSLSSSIRVYMHEITSAWDETEVTWSSKPTISPAVTDYCNLTASSTSISFDVTKLYYQWSEEENINGVAVKLNDAGAVSFSSENAENPVLLLNYISTVGIDEDFSFTEFDMGSAGYVYINNLSGNLVLTRDEFDTTGDNYPYDFSGTYNSLGSVSGSDPLWVKSYDSRIFMGLIYLDSDGSAELLNIKETATAESETMFEDNKFGWEKIKIIDFYTITIPMPPILGGDKVLKFPNTIDAWRNGGAERYRFNTNGLVEQSVCENGTEHIVFSREAIYNEDGTENKNAFYVVDGDGDKLLISNTGTSYSVTQKDYKDDGSIVDGDTLVYTKDENGNVTQITLNGNVQAIFTYDASGRMTSVTNDVGYKLSFGYQGESKKIESVAESKDGVSGQQVSFTRTYNSTKARTAGADGVYESDDDLFTIYKFDEEAKLASTQSATYNGDDLGASVYEYAENEEEADTTNGLGGLTKVSAIGKNVENLLQNHNLESANKWTLSRLVDGGSTYAASATTEKAYAGNGSLKIKVTDFTKAGSVVYAQTFTPVSGLLKEGEIYTASAFINASGLTRDTNIASTRGYGAGIVVGITTADGTDYIYSDTITNTNPETNDGWERVFATFTVPTNYTKINILLTMRNAIGTAYFDAVQLETGDTPNQYNLLENNGFDYADSNGHATNWIRHNLETSDVVSNGEMKLVGNPSKAKGVYQDVIIGDSSQDENYIYSGWVTADAMPKGPGRYFVLYPMVFYKDANGNESSIQQQEIYYDVNDIGEQYISGTISLEHPDDSTLIPYKIRIAACYYRECNTAYYDRICLYRSADVYDLTEEEEANDSYVYDDNGNVVSYTDDEGILYEYTYHTLSDGSFVTATEKVTETKTVEGIETTEITIYEYNTQEVLIRETTPDNKVYSYTYDSLGNLTSKLTSDGLGDRYTYAYYDTDNDGTNDASDVLSEIYEDGTSHTYTYDANGNLTYEASVEDGKTYSCTYTYDDMNNLLSQIDSDGKTNIYTYVYFDTNNDGINDKSAVATESLEDGTVNTYTYSAYNKLTRQTTTKDDKTLAYNYDDEGNLLKVEHNGFEYNYEYDAFGNTTAVKVGSQNLISYTYQPDKSKISSELYGNGSKINYTYNSYGQVYTKTSEGLGTVTTKYDALGNIIIERDEPGGIKTYYQYDSEGRMYGEKVASSSIGNSNYNFLYSSNNLFDDEGNVIKNSVTAGDRTFSTSYDYTESGLSSQALLATTRKVDFTYNEDDVLIKRTMSTSSPLIQLFEYDENDLISGHTLSRGTDEDIVYSYSYTYDDNGNITEIKKGDTVQQSYVYDANNQLVRENNLDTNKTIVYTYDDGGNIKTKTEYAYTLNEEKGTAVDVVNYSYDDTWKDKLTYYDGKSITYDAIGNPTNYMGAEMTWFARQMMSYETDDLDITYKYDSDGLRTQKVVNGVKHEYYYVDGLLVYENIGDENLMYYRYDQNGTVIAINRIRLSDGATGLLYPVTNSRGDVVELRNGNGVLNAKYTYDSWGKLISITDASGNPVSEDSLAMFNSIRYRGYVYDRETGLYYLQSRYYDPETGRFLNADAVDYLGASGTMLGYNAFAYCENNPVNKIDKTGTIGTPLQWAFTILGAIVGLPFGKWLANRLGYYSGWKYKAIRTAAVVGGAALGWFAGSVLLRLIKTYFWNNPQIMIKISSKYGLKTLSYIRRVLNLDAVFANRAMAEVVFAKNVVHIFSTKHIADGIMKLGYSKWYIFYKAYSIVMSKLSQAVPGSNQIHTYINGYKVTIRFYLKDGFIGSFDIFMGWATRIVGKLLK